MELFLKALAGAGIVLLIQVLSRTKNFYLAGLVPLFPTFSLISHYIVGTERTIPELKATILFGVVSLIPYLGYLLSLYGLLDKCRFSTALVGATGVWLVMAIIAIVLWTRW